MNQTLWREKTIRTSIITALGYFLSSSLPVATNIMEEMNKQKEKDDYRFGVTLNHISHTKNRANCHNFM